MTTTEVRASLHDVLERVARGDEVTITRHGEPVAVLVRPDALRHRRAADVLEGAARVRALIEAGATRSLDELEPLPPGLADQRVTELRAERDAD